MSAMKDIATELETMWTHTYGIPSWHRRMPNGTHAIIYPEPCRLIVGVDEVWSGGEVHDAVREAGKIAKAQLLAQMETWS